MLCTQRKLYKISCNQSSSVLPAGNPDGARLGPSNGCTSEAPEVKRQKWFRWHDAGDIQSAKHLTNIFEVCNQTPATSHWLPTREAKFLKFIDPDTIPANLIIRLSGHMVDGKNATWWPWTSSVSTKTKSCPAKDQGNKCLDCRSCWNREVPNVTYPKH